MFDTDAIASATFSFERSSNHHLLASQTLKAFSLIVSQKQANTLLLIFGKKIIVSIIYFQNSLERNDLPIALCRRSDN